MCCCIFCFLCEGGNFNAMIDFSQLPTEYERECRKQIRILRNLHKQLPNSAEARRRMQKLKQVEKESVEQKRLLCLLKKKALKVAKKEADKDGRDKAEEEEEEVNISQVGLLSSSTVTVKKGKRNKDMIDFRKYSIRVLKNFRFPNPEHRCRKKKNSRRL